MKKKIALLLGMALTVSALAGCTNRKPEDVAQAVGGAAEDETKPEDGAQTGSDGADAGTPEDTGTPENTGSEQVEDGTPAGAGTEMVDGSTEATPGGLKTGLAIATSVESSADASADAEGIAQTDAMIAAVTVDAEGKIVACVIDCAQTVINFGTDGTLKTDTGAEVPSKNELGTSYGMSKASSIGKDWNEQAAAFAEYCVGRTADEVMGIAVTEGVPSDADLAAGCTMHIGGLQEVVAQAVANATEMGAQAGDKLGVGVVTSIADSTDAAADAEGVAQAYTTVSALTVNADGVITSAQIDAVQANVKFDATGKITTDLTAAVDSKNVIGAGYGMKAASSIGKEWNEQAAAYAQYAIGKTADEVNGTAVTEGVPSDADLAASVTIHVTDFNSVITKAADSAK